jgi:uncharacterized protein (TIGR03083 family)
MVEMRHFETVYEQTRRRVAGLVGGNAGNAQQVATAAVPACPAWSVHDVLAHVTGVCADIMAGNVLGAATDDWTAAQVAARRHVPVPEIVAEWEDLGPKVAALIDDLPEPYGQQVVADLAVHEHDIRGSLGHAGARDSEAMWLAIDFLVSIVAQPGAASLALPPLAIRVDDRSWIVGDGASPAGTLATDPFELFRALTGRRSADQIRQFEWTVEPGPYLPLFGLGPFAVRETSLVE